MCFWVQFWSCHSLHVKKVICNRHQSLKWSRNSKLNQTNDFCYTQYGCDQMNRALQEKPPLSLVPGKEICGCRSGPISRSGKRGISKRSMSSLQLLRCLELPWCSVSKEQIGFPLAIVFIQIFPQMQAKDLFTICLSDSWCLSRPAL